MILRTWLRSLVHVASRQRRGAFRFRFHVMHTTVRFNVIFFFTLLVFSRIADTKKETATAATMAAMLAK